MEQNLILYKNKNNKISNVKQSLLSEYVNMIEKFNVCLYLRSILHVFWALHHVVVCIYCFSIDLSQSEDDLMKDVRDYSPAFLTGWNIVSFIIYYI